MKDMALLRKIGLVTGMVLTRVQHAAARRLARAGLVDLITHDDEGYELWHVSITDAGEAAITRHLAGAE